MRNLSLLAFIAFILFSCGNQKAQNRLVEKLEQEGTVLTVDQLYENAAELADKEILVRGTVMHVCMEGGERCFIMGSNEDVIIRIEAGEKIGAFSQELMGSEIEVIGVLTAAKTEAEAHNPGQHGEGEQKENVETEKAHQVIAESQEEQETVYYIKGLKSKEL